MQKHGRKALGLVLMAALGLMAFTATAQAAALRSHHTAILLGGTPLTSGASKTLAGRQTSATGVLSIPAKNTEIVCQKGEVVEATAKNETDTKKNPEGKELTEVSDSGLQGMFEGKVEFSECVVNTFVLKGGVKTELKESVPCTKAFNEHNKNPNGVAGRPRGHGLMLTYLHLSATVVHTLIVRITQLLGVPFSTLEFGGTCSLPKEVEVTGSIAGEISAGSETDVKEVPINIESETAKGKELSTLAETKLLFGTSEAFLEGTAVALLTGVASWGVM